MENGYVVGMLGERPVDVGIGSHLDQGGANRDINKQIKARQCAPLFMLDLAAPS